MHVYWTGLAADLLPIGDGSCRWMLEEAASGEIFAAGHGEGVNDFPVTLSTQRKAAASRQPRLFRFRDWSNACAVAFPWLLTKGDDIAPVPGTKRVSGVEANVGTTQSRIAAECKGRSQVPTEAVRNTTLADMGA
jgi:hypothetical protein